MMKDFIGQEIAEGCYVAYPIVSSLMVKKKVSFDYDDCLSDLETVQDYCKQLLLRPDVEVWIVTSRPKDPEAFFRARYTAERFAEMWGDHQIWANDEDLYPMADALGIPRDRIVFTNWGLKADWFEQFGHDFVWHLDDNREEIGAIAQQTKVVPLSCVGGIQFIHKGNKLLNK